MVASSKLVAVVVNPLEVLAVAPAVVEEAVVEALPVAEQDQAQEEGLVASVELLAALVVSAALGELVVRVEVVQMVEVMTQNLRLLQRQR